MNNLQHRCIDLILDNEIPYRNQLTGDLEESIHTHKVARYLIFRQEARKPFKWDDRLRGVYDHFHTAVLDLFNISQVDIGYKDHPMYNFIVKCYKNKLDFEECHYYFTFLTETSRKIKLIKCESIHADRIDYLDTYIERHNNSPEWGDEPITSEAHIRDIDFNYTFPQLEAYNATCDLK